jgi:hypothetical protein
MAKQRGVEALFSTKCYKSSLKELDVSITVQHDYWVIDPQTVVAIVAKEIHDPYLEKALKTRKDVLKHVHFELESSLEDWIQGDGFDFHSTGVDPKSAYEEAFALVDHLFPEWHIPKTCKAWKDFWDYGD